MPYTLKMMGYSQPWLGQARFLHNPYFTVLKSSSFLLIFDVVFDIIVKCKHNIVCFKGKKKSKILKTTENFCFQQFLLTLHPVSVIASALQCESDLHLFRCKSVMHKNTVLEFNRLSLEDILVIKYSY